MTTDPALVLPGFEPPLPIARVSVADRIAQHEAAIRAWECFPCLRCEHTYGEHHDGLRGRPAQGCTHRDCCCVAFDG